MTFGCVRLSGGVMLEAAPRVKHPEPPPPPNRVTNILEGFAPYTAAVLNRKKATEEDLDVNVVTINMSKSMDQVNALDVHAYPTIRLYKNDGKAIKFPRKPRKMENMLEFLHENGITQKKK